VRTRLLDPLSMHDTFVEGDEEIPGGFLPGYYGSTDITDSIHPSAAWAAGGIVSNTRDLTRWAQALFGGEVLSPTTLELMVTPTGAAVSAGYGFGIAVDSSSFGPYRGGATPAPSTASPHRSVTSPPSPPRSPPSSTKTAAPPGPWNPPPGPSPSTDRDDVNTVPGGARGGSRSGW
jgi:CubicO group peptidase (beta-lactamase class C family)